MPARLLFVTLVCLCWPFRAAAEEALDLCFDDVNFTPGSHAVADATQTLKRVAEWLGADPARKVILTGYADRLGDPSYNDYLAQRRAETVRNHLAELGVSGDRIQANGGGMTGCLANAEERMKARRVRIELVGGPCIGTESAKTEQEAEAVADQYSQEVQERLDEVENPQVLIFLAPDPVDSHFSRDFDVYVSAFRQAMGSMGYELERFEMTWPRFGPDGVPEGKARGSLGDAVGLRATLTRYRRTPSVMIFSGNGRSVVVFVVGETPTWGLQTRAFRSALKRAPLVGRMRKQEQRISPIEVGIIGPTYSGTIASLARELDRWQTAKAASATDAATTIGTIKVLSGTASNRENRETLCDLRDVEYDQLPTSTAFRLGMLIKYVRDSDKRIACRNIVILRESSAFGTAEVDDSVSSCTAGELDSVTYPINISALREAHGRAEKPRETAAPLLGTNGSEQLDYDPVFQLSRLAISLSGTSSPDDRMPLYGIDLTPQTLDMVVADVLRKLNLQSVRAIGIVGTNIRDKLFLAAEIARHADGVRIFTDEPDILLSHPRFSFASHGILTIANNRMDDEIDGTRYDFPSDAAHGIFLATRRQGKMLRFAEKARNAAASRREQFGGCDSPERPPLLWTGVVGRGRLITTGYYSYRSNQAEAESHKDCDADSVSGGNVEWHPDRPRAYGKRAWVVLSLVLTGLTLVFLTPLSVRPSWRKWSRTKRIGLVVTAITPFVTVLASTWLQHPGDPSATPPTQTLADLGWLSIALVAFPPRDLLILPSLAFGLVLAGVTLFADELRTCWSKRIDSRLSLWAGENKKRRRTIGSIKGLTQIALTPLAIVMVAPYCFVGVALAQTPHLDLDGGMSLILPAVFAHVVLCGLLLLSLERERVRMDFELDLETNRKLRLFGGLSRAWYCRAMIAASIAASIFLAVVADMFGLSTPLAHTLERSRAMNATINAIWLSLSAMAIEAMIFAYTVSGGAVRRSTAYGEADIPKLHGRLRALGRYSVVAGPASFLLLLLALEVYPFEPRGLLTLTLTLLVGCSVAVALWILLRFEPSVREDAPGRRGLDGLMGMFSRERVPLGAVAAVSALGLLPNVRERLGGLVDLLVRLIG